MGGQACVFYGAAEFSRDTDLAILVSSENLARLNKTLAGLDAGALSTHLENELWTPKNPSMCGWLPL